jgi:hypothetical protein
MKSAVTDSNWGKWNMKRPILFAITAMAMLLSAEVPLVRADESLYAPASSCEVRRAGFPFCISRLAAPSNTCRYDGYSVGGGCPTYCGPGRCTNQGTWGWDYVGKCLPRVVRLGWWCPSREQGGPGSYEPDGPNCIESIRHHLETHGEY